MFALALLASLCSVSTLPSALPAPPPPVVEVKLKWNHKPYALDALPEELGPGPAAAAGVWADWVAGHGYQMHLDPSGRVLLISSKKNSKVRRQLKLIADVSKLFDDLLPAPPRAEPKAPGGEGEGLGRFVQGDDEIPEDPDGGPVGWLDGVKPPE